MSQYETGDMPLQVLIALAAVQSFSSWSKRLQNGSILPHQGPLTLDACRNALVDDYDDLISSSIHHAPLWNRPSPARSLMPRPKHELLSPSHQRIILCDVLDTRVSILYRPPADHQWLNVDTGKGDCSQFTRETLMIDIPESMDADPVSFVKETVFYSNEPFPSNCDQLVSKVLPRVQEFVNFSRLTTLHLTFHFLRVLIPSRSGVLRRRIPSLGLAAWLKNFPECEQIRAFRYETVQEVMLSGEQHWQEDLDEILFPSILEPALDAYVRRLGELFPNSLGLFACGGWLASRMFREALLRNGFDYCLLPPERSLSLWPILLAASANEE